MCRGTAWYRALVHERNVVGRPGAILTGGGAVHDHRCPGVPSGITQAARSSRCRSTHAGAAFRPGSNPDLLEDGNIMDRLAIALFALTLTLGSACGSDNTTNPN